MSETQLAPRARIIDAAVRVFGRDGYDAGSLTDVAASAGLSRPNLLYYYPSKRDLLLAVLENRDAELDRARHFGDPHQYSTFAEYIADLAQSPPVIYSDRDLVALYHRLVAEAADPDHPARDWVLHRHSRLRDTFTRMIDAGVARGELREDLDPQHLAIALLGAVEGIESQWLIDPSIDWTAATDSLRALVALTFTT